MKILVSLSILQDLLNIRYIHGNCEADLCSKLNDLKIVDMVLSDDMDHLIMELRFW